MADEISERNAFTIEEGERQPMAVRFLDARKTFIDEIENIEKEGLSDERRNAIAKEMLIYFSQDMQGIATIGLFPGAFYDQIQDYIHAMQEKIQNASIRFDDVRGVVVFLEGLLALLYPGKTIKEIEDELGKNNSKGEMPEAFDLSQLSPDMAAEIINDQALKLYNLRYQWGYYPEATRGLSVETISLDAAIDKRRHELMAKYFDKGLSKDYNLDLIYEKIKNGKASGEEEELYALWRNKITSNWISGIRLVLSVLRLLGDQYAEIDAELEELQKHIGEIRKGMAIRAAEQKTTAGFIPFADRATADRLRDAVQRCDQLIDETFFELFYEKYPEKVRGGVLRREDLKKIVGLESEGAVYVDKLLHTFVRAPHEDASSKEKIEWMTVALEYLKIIIDRLPQDVPLYAGFGKEWSALKQIIETHDFEGIAALSVEVRDIERVKKLIYAVLEEAHHAIALRDINIKK